MDDFYVYEHVRPDTGAVFYVGKGRRRRAYALKGGRNQRHERVVNKLAEAGLSVSIAIVADGLSEEQAFRLERERIALWRVNNAPLVNMTDGGEGTSGLPSWRKGKPPSPKEMERLRALAAAQRGKSLSPERVAKMAEAARGRVHSPETRAKIAAANRLRVWSPETGAKISAATTGKHGGPKSAQTRERMRKPKSPEHRAKLRKPRSAEARARMSVAQYRRWALAKAKAA
jgi:hypothetical protein